MAAMRIVMRIPLSMLFIHHWTRIFPGWRGPCWVSASTTCSKQGWQFQSKLLKAFFFTWLLKTSLFGQPVLILNCLVTIIFPSYSNNLLFCVMINVFSHNMHFSKEHTSVIVGHEVLSFNCPDALPLNLLLSILYWGRSDVMSKIGQM